MENPPRSASRVRQVFIREGGIRAGWSVLLFGALFLILMFAIRMALRPLAVRATVMTPRNAVLNECCLLSACGIATWVMARIERRPFLSYGFTGERRIVRMLGGAVSGVLGLSLLVGLLAWRGLLVFDGRALAGVAALRYAVGWGGIFFLVALAEESLLRGYLQATLTRGLGFWWAALLLSLGFGAMHGGNQGECPVGLLAAACAGLVFCLGLRLTGSLFWVVGLHAGWDWAESYLYGVADSGLMIDGHLFMTHTSGSPMWSGGATGPEGSILVLPVLGLMALGMWWTWGRTR